MTSVVEKALELAQSGEYRWVGEIVRTMEKAGYDRVEQHLDGRFTRRQIMEAIKHAKSLSTDDGTDQNRILIKT